MAGPGDVQRAVGTVLVGATLLLALNASEVLARRQVIAVLVVAAIVVAVIIASVTGKGATVEGIAAIADALLLALAPPVVVVGVYRNMRATGTVTVTVVLGVLYLYMLLGLFFALVTSRCRIWAGLLFSNGAGAASPRSVYVSFVTLATVGYGGYTARTNFGRTLSITEALIGQSYLVTVVAAIVGRVVPRSAKAS